MSVPNAVFYSTYCFTGFECTLTSVIQTLPLVELDSQTDIQMAKHSHKKPNAIVCV